jgi:hypothetical protein
VKGSRWKTIDGEHLPIVAFPLVEIGVARLELQIGGMEAEGEISGQTIVEIPTKHILYT